MIEDEDVILLEDDDVIIFKGGNGRNSWWISLDKWHRCTFILTATTGIVFIFDSAFKNTLDAFEMEKINASHLLLATDGILFAFIFCGSFAYTKIVRKEMLLQRKHEQQIAELRDAELTRTNENFLLREKLYSQTEKVHELEDMVMVDYLTKLLNREGTMRTLEQYSARAKRHKGEVHILFIDIDKMKHINAEFGHPNGGDVAIVEVANAIKKTARNEEPGCRFGGDEFLMIIYHEKISSENIKQTEAIRKRLQKTVDKIDRWSIPIAPEDSRDSKKIPISVTISTHILNLKKPLKEELNKASGKMLTLK